MRPLDLEVMQPQCKKHNLEELINVKGTTNTRDVKIVACKIHNSGISTLFTMLDLGSVHPIPYFGSESVNINTNLLPELGQLRFVIHI